MSIKADELKLLEMQYPPGSRVELVAMDDPYCGPLIPGSIGTVVLVDAIGTIHVKWDCGSSLGIAYGVDRCRLVECE